MSLPVRGEYFVFELDPVASIATFEDPIATKACKEMQNKQYLACVIEVSYSFACLIHPDISKVAGRHTGRKLPICAGHHAGLNSWNGPGTRGKHAS